MECYVMYALSSGIMVVFNKFRERKYKDRFYLAVQTVLDYCISYFNNAKVDGLVSSWHCKKIRQLKLNCLVIFDANKNISDPILV